MFSLLISDLLSFCRNSKVKTIRRNHNKPEKAEISSDLEHELCRLEHILCHIIHNLRHLINVPSHIIHELYRLVRSPRRLEQLPTDMERYPSHILCILIDLGRTGLYVAVAFVGYADDAFWGDLAAGYLEGGGDGAVLEQAFAGAERDRDYHQLHRVDEIVFEEGLKHVRAAHYVYVRAVLSFELTHFFGDVAAQKDARLPIA